MLQNHPKQQTNTIPSQDKVIFWLGFEKRDRSKFFGLQSNSIGSFCHLAGSTLFFFLKRFKNADISTLNFQFQMIHILYKNIFIAYIKILTLFLFIQ